MRFLLVDRITALEPGRSIAGWKCVAMGEDYLEWHFPEQPIVPGVLVLEAFAQLAGWLEAAGSSFERWVLLDRVVSARWFGPSIPGDRIELRLEQVPSPDPSRRAYRGEAEVAGERRVSVEFEAHAVALGDLEDRERAIRTLRTLRGEPPETTARRGGRP
jgi:3-hydroxyacyl-[acyl-carrier-protein] dehydratase